MPSALTSGVIETLSMDRISVGMVSTPGGRQNTLAVTLSKEIVKASRSPANTAGMMSGRRDLAEGLQPVGAERQRRLVAALRR
ncbi:MAG: hypothetical protein R3D57_05565 [Hyphomicrobiaceae bacterium]